MTGWVLGSVLWLLATLPLGFHGRHVSRAELTGYVSAYHDWPVTRMVDVAECESRGYVRAVSPTGDIGLFQVHIVSWYDRFVPKWIMVSPVYATWVAHQIWEIQGPTAWSCWR